MDLHYDMGEFVRERRRVNGMTQRELGELAGVGTRFVSELERNKPTVRLDAVRKVLAVFGKTIALVDRPPVEMAPSPGTGETDLAAPGDSP